ncbi:MAG: DUF2520 domain-containing protein [Flavobacterium sp.]|nr:MAG: DUF2520 domain-containing protein [Flavobacterium sp.]
MVKVTIIGSGNVAQHLVAAFSASDSVELVQVFSRDISKIGHLVSAEISIDNLGLLADADLYIISVSDDAISEVSEQLPFSGNLVAHTSGSVPIDELDSKNRSAVFYPLQTFTKNKPVNFREIPICLESGDKTDYQTLEVVARAISDKVFAIDSVQRKALHVAAVFASNFTNHMYKIANDICEENQMPFDILKPLIAETANKIRLLSPADAQTGPAKRNDKYTIASHLDFLKDDNRNNIYKTLTQSILDDGKKL